MAKKSEPDVIDDLDEAVSDDAVEQDTEATEVSEPAQEVPPKPKPGDADYDWSVIYGLKNGEPTPTYRHTLPDGKVIEIPKFRFPGGAIFRKLRNVPEWDQPRQLLDMCLDTCPVAADLIDAVPVRWDDDIEDDFIDVLTNQWFADATKPVDGGEGMTPGE